jgi:hypothetical protein
MDAQALYFSALLSKGTPTGLKLVKKEQLAEDWHAIFDWVVAFVNREGKLPRAETVEATFSRPFPTANEDVQFYANAIRDNAMRVHLEDGLTEQVVAPLREAKPGEALEGARKVVAEVSKTYRDFHHTGLVVPSFSAREAVERRMSDYYRRKASQDRIGLPLPWPTITRATNGLMPGAYWFLLARPEMGKTWAMVVLAIWYWQMGLNVLFVSMETPAEGPLPREKTHRLLHGFCLTCYQHVPTERATEECPAASIPHQQLSIRFDAVGSRLSAWRLLKGLLTPHEERALREYYDRLIGNTMPWGSLRIVAAPYISTLTDLQMEVTEFRPDVLLLDSWYLAVEEGARKNEMAGALVRDTKRIIEPRGIPTIVSWHLNRDVKEDATDASINDAILTDEIARIPDVALLMFRPKEMQIAGEALWRAGKVRDGLAMRELKTHFRMKDEINFAEIGEPPRKEDLKNIHGK